MMEAIPMTTGAAQAAALFSVFDLIPETPIISRLDQASTLDTFHSFLKLPCELRCAIWERLWPPPRLICIALYEDESTHKFTDLAATDTGCFDDILPSICRVPIALQVCQESRRHTLRRYRAIKYVSARDARLYVNPSRDLLWSDAILIDELQNLVDRGYCYRSLLAHIEMLFVEEEEWRGYNDSNSLLKYFVPFTGLKVILILLEDEIEIVADNEGTDTADERTDSEGNDEQDSSGREGGHKEKGLKLKSAGCQRLHRKANELRVEYTQLFGSKGIAKHIWFVDKTGSFH